MKNIMLLLLLAPSAHGLSIVSPSAVHVMAVQLEVETGVPAAVQERLAWSESSYRWWIANPSDPSAGLDGLKISLLPWFSLTFFGGRPIDPYNWRESMTVAARYLAWIHDRLAYKDWYFACLAYKTGHLDEVALPSYWPTVSPMIRSKCWEVAHGRTEQ